MIPVGNPYRVSQNSEVLLIKSKMGTENSDLLYGKTRSSQNKFSFKQPSLIINSLDSFLDTELTMTSKNKLMKFSGFGIE